MSSFGRQYINTHVASHCLQSLYVSKGYTAEAKGVRRKVFYDSGVSCFLVWIGPTDNIGSLCQVFFIFALNNTHGNI